MITAFDVKAPNTPKEKRPLKPLLTKYLIYAALILLYPIFFLVAFSVIGTQGLISRYRVSKILSRNILDSESISNQERFIDGDFLAGALDAVNLPGDSSPPPLKRSSSSTHTTKETAPGKCLVEKAKPLQLNEATKQIFKNLNLLQWEKVYVYIRAFNAHGTIVCREKRFTTDGGEATIKHFIDTTHLSK